MDSPPPLAGTSPPYPSRSAGSERPQPGSPPGLQFRLQFNAVRHSPAKTDQGRWSSLNRSGLSRPELLMRLGVAASKLAVALLAVRLSRPSPPCRGQAARGRFARLDHGPKDGSYRGGREDQDAAISAGRTAVRRAISGPLTPVMSGLSRSLADTSPRRSGHVTGPDGTDSQADSLGSASSPPR